MKEKKISPSLLSADFANLERDIRMLEKGGAHLLHVDVMDGHFVPNLTIGPPVVAAIKKVSTVPLDVHLMIENPGQYIDDYAKAGAAYITVHVEATHHLHRVLQQIKAHGIKAGVSLNPHTPLSTIEYVLQDLDMVLIMSVNPGFGGQSFIPQALDKVRALKKMLQDRNLNQVEIEIDGGIKLDNIKEVSEAGVDIFVSGSGIFGAPDPAAMIQRMIDEVG
jgi:ribulose-phosphate 3-epimerase